MVAASPTTCSTLPSRSCSTRLPATPRLPAPAPSPRSSSRWPPGSCHGRTGLHGTGTSPAALSGRPRRSARASPRSPADAHAYEDALAALRGREELAVRPDQQPRAALDRAADIPLRIVAAGYDLAYLAAVSSRTGDPALRADAAAAALLAGSARAAAHARRDQPRGHCRRSEGRRARSLIASAAEASRGRSSTAGEASYDPPMAEPDARRTDRGRSPRGASPPAPPRTSRIRSNGPARSRASGRGAARPARACASASSTAASRRTIRRRRRPQRGRVALGDGWRSRDRGRTPRAISAATARPAPGSSASLAPDCELHSVRVLGAGFTGSGRSCWPVCAGRSSRASTSST